MADDKSDVPTHKQRRPFTHLNSKLVQLVNDRFDEDQYDQAVELLEQLRAEGIRPPKSLIQKLVGLSLCSLAPGQVASTSRWTLDHQLHDIASRLLTQHKGSKGDRNVMKAVSSASDRPSPSSVLKASSLLVQYSQSSYDISADDTEARSEAECRSALLARQLLEALPSQRRPLEDSRPVSPKPSRHSEHSDQDGSFEVSSIEQWIRNDLGRAEDVWDLLCDRRFSSGKDVGEASLGQISEFWMNDSERKRYHKQLQSTVTGHQRLEDRLKDIRQRKRNGDTHDLSDSSSDDSSAEDDAGPRRSIAGRAAQPFPKSNSKRKLASLLDKPVKRVKSGNLARNDDETHPTKIKMTEGAWRTLSVLLRLWNQASPQTTATKAEADSPSEEQEPPLLWQFPRSHSERQSGCQKSRRAISKDATDELDRALDVAFSFPSILPAYTPSSTGAEVTTNLFDMATSAETRGDARLFSSVPEAELMHRQEIGEHKEERLMAIRADAAAWLLSSMYNLVERNYISSIAFTQGMSERMEALRAQEIQYLMLSLLPQQPHVVANVLALYLDDASRTRPDKRRSPDPVQFHFDAGEDVAMDASLAYAMPHGEAAAALAGDYSKRWEDRDARAVLLFLSSNKLDVDESANSNLPLTFPSKSDSRKQAVVQIRSRRQVKVDSDTRKASKMKIKSETANAPAVLTEGMKKDGLVAFAFVRAAQMEARNRMNQIKFLIARALLVMHVSKEASRMKQDPDIATTSNGKPADSKGSKPIEAESASQRRNLHLFLTRLLKAFEHDALDFRSCLSAMKTHVGRDHASRRRKNLSDLLAANSSKDASAALPSLEAMVERCQKCFDATQDLARATRLLLDSTKFL